MTPQNPDQADVSLDRLMDLDKACDRFEQSWLQGKRLAIETVRADPQWSPAERRYLLVELLAMEFEYRYQAQEPVSVEEYERRFPGDENAIREAHHRVTSRQPAPSVSLTAENAIPAASLPSATAPNLDQYIRRITESGLMSANEIDVFVVANRPTTAEQLARALSRDGRLTKYQAQSLYQGRIKGLVLGEYCVLDKLGQGGMGVVLKAYHRRMERVVAVKMIAAAYMKSDQAVDRFYREVRAAARLNHPNIVTAHDAGEHEGMHYLVMEYVAGRDLATVLKQDGPLSVARSVDFILQAAQGLQYAHQQGIVHRDIKPANLLVDQSGVVKILDMGLARVTSLGDEDERDRLTDSGQVMGSCDYMAPEQARDSRHADARADVYSLGCTLYRLLTGKVVYPGDTLANVLSAHQNSPLPSLSHARADVPPQLDAVFRRMLAKRPEDRYQSMAEVIVALRACQVQSPPVIRSAEDKLVAVGEQPRVPVAAEIDTTKPAQDFSGNWGPPIPPRKLAKGMLLTGASSAAVILLLAILFAIRTSYGTVKIELSDPGAKVDVKIDGDMIELTGLKEPLRIKAGEHGLTVTSGDFETVTEQFTVGKDQEKLMRVTLVPKEGAKNAAPAETVARQANSDPTPGLPSAKTPVLEEVAAQWLPPDPDRAAQVQASREASLKGLEELDWPSIEKRTGQPSLHDPTRLFSSRPSTDRNSKPDLPDRFVLAGKLEMVRKLEGRVLVFLEATSEATRFSPVLSMMGGVVGPVVQWDSADLPLWMADYKKGDPVRVVVKRHDWGERTSPPHFRPGTSAALSPGLRTFLVVRETSSSDRPFINSALYWCCKGEGIEKANRSDTWIDAQLGRAAKLANPEAVCRSPGFLVRTAADRKPVEGQIVGRFRGTTTDKTTGTVASLTVPDSVEGPIKISVQLGRNVIPAEFLDYQRDELVEVAVASPQPSPSMKDAILALPGFRSSGSNETLLWSGILFAGSQIQLQGEPSSRVFIHGERRSNVTIGDATPDVAAFRLSEVLGREVTWSGRLQTFRRREGQTHLTAAPAQSITGLRYFEAYTPDAAFFEELLDYVDYDGKMSKADQVTVTGTIVRADDAPWRIDRSAPLLKIASIERKSSPASRAVVGSRRSPDSLRTDTVKTGLARLIRDWPTIGTSVEFTGQYDGYSSTEHEMNVKPPKEYGHTVVAFPRAVESMFADYRNGELVTVKAMVAEFGNELKLAGKRVVRVANPRSLITDQGRPTPPLDLSIDKDRWKAAREKLNDNIGTTLQGCGLYNGYTRNPAYCNVRIKDPFLEHGEIELVGKPAEGSEEFLKRLHPGDEVLFEFVIEGGSFFKPSCGLQWIAQAADPDVKKAFSRIRTPATTTQPSRNLPPAK